MQKKIILIDLDKTLIDQNYKLTAPRKTVAAFVKRARKKGFISGISSDSALETIRLYTKGLDITYPIIAENGALVFFSKKEMTPTIKTVLSFTLARRALAKNMADPKTYILIGDVNALSRSVIGSRISFNDADKLLLINGYREKSLSFYCFKKNKGIWRLDGKFLDAVVNKCRKKIKDRGVVFDVNYEYGICIARAKGVNKSLALPLLKKRYNAIFVIGDSMGDFYKKKSVIQCAVANASKEYKKKCSIVAKKNYTKGVLEIIDIIINQWYTGSRVVH